jgi:hypothetical protein
MGFTTPEDDLNKPIQEVADRALAHILTGALIWQKWTCGKCGSRQTMSEANKFFRYGTCEECSETTEILYCNFLLVAATDGADLAELLDNLPVHGKEN